MLSLIPYILPSHKGLFDSYWSIAGCGIIYEVIETQCR